MLGTIINAAAIVAGSILGLVLHRKLPEKLSETAFNGIGIFTLFLGFTLATKTGNYLILIFSIALGSLTGEALNIEKMMEKSSEKLKRLFKSRNDRFSEGLVTAFLLYCMGSMTILGAIEEGLGGKPNLLLAKSLLDGFSSIALTSTLGIGVMFSIIPLIIYQGGLTLLTSILGNYFNQAIVDEVTACGGLILVAMGIRVLNIKQIRVLNMLPALIYAVILGYFLV